VYIFRDKTFLKPLHILLIIEYGKYITDFNISTGVASNITHQCNRMSLVSVPLYSVHKYTYHFYCHSQLEKQQKLNELNVVVSVKLHQIQYMINGVLPQDLSQTLVFESNGVSRLQFRIKELEHEKFSQKKFMR